MRGRLGSLRAAPLTPADPHPSAATRSRPVSAGALRADRGGGGRAHPLDPVDKVVLARELTVEAPAAHDPARQLGALRDLFPSCFCFCFGTGRGGLPRREPGAARAALRAPWPRPSRSPGRPPAARTRPSTITSARRCCAARRSATSTASSCGGSSGRCARTRSGSTPRAEPFVVKVGNLQHLATPIRAQLAESHSAIELAGFLHPTPAIGGEPRAPALELIRGARGDRPRLVHGPGRLDGRRRGRRVLRRPALRARSGTARRICSPAAGSSRTPIPPPSFRNPSSSSRRCCRC